MVSNAGRPGAPGTQTGPHHERLAGAVERVTFHSGETGFCVLRVKVRGQRDLVTVTGYAAAIGAGEYVEAAGVWLNDRQHGLQFKAERIEATVPTTLEGLEKYLGSGMIKGIGPVYAKKLVATFGAEVFEVIEREPARLREVTGIGPVREAKIIRGWSDQRAIREIIVWLYSHRVSSARAVRIYKTYGEGAIAVTFKFIGGVSRFSEKLIGGMVERGYPREFAERTFRQLEGFGSYGFPESHAANFAKIAYASAWMKYHHPDVFCAALVNAQPMGFYGVAQVVGDARKHGVEVRPPCINASRWDCTLEPTGGR